MGVSIGFGIGPVRVSRRLGRHRRRRTSPGLGHAFVVLLAAAFVFFAAVACWTVALLVLGASLAKPEWRPVARRTAAIPWRVLNHLI